MSKHTNKHFTMALASNCEPAYKQGNKQANRYKHMCKLFRVSPVSKTGQVDKQAYEQAKRMIFHSSSCK